MDHKQLDDFLHQVTPREQYYLDNPGSPSPRFKTMEHKIINGQDVLCFPLPTLDKDEIHIRKDSRFTDVPPYMHSNVNVNFIYSGQCDYIINGMPITLHRGDVCIFDLDVVRRKFYLGENDIIINLNMSHDFFSNSFLREAGEQSIFSTFMFHVLSEKALSHNHFMIFQAGSNQRVYKLFVLLLEEYFDEGIYHKSMVQGYLQLIFLQLLGMYQQSPENHLIQIVAGKNNAIMDILYYLEKNSADCTLKQLADHFGYHPKYITALLKQITGLSFKQIQVRERLKNAATMLRQTDNSIQEIANQVGAGNLSSFYRDFNRRYGMSPAAWRKQHR